MSDNIQALPAAATSPTRFSAGNVWNRGLLAALAWALAASVTYLLPNVIPWGSTNLFASLVAAGAALFLFLSIGVPWLGRFGRALIHFGPWFVALGLWFALWEVTTAKLGWLPKPFFSPPQGLLDVYIGDGPRLMICILYSLRLWTIGFGLGIAAGYALGIALGWSKTFSYWGMPVLKLIGPVPATAWIPCTFFFFSDHLRRQRLHRGLGLRHSGRDPHRVRRRFGQPLLL